MTIDRNALRNDVLDAIATSINGGLDIKRQWRNDEKTGPLGGISAQLEAWVEVDGEIVSLAVSVYSDERTDESLRSKLVDEAEDRKRQADLRSLLDVDEKF